MWKYIIIGAGVLFLGASYFFYAANTAMTSPDGELAAFQSRYEQAVKKSRDVELDLAIKKYAEVRADFFRLQKQRYIEHKAALDTEDAGVVIEVNNTRSELEAAKADLQRLRDEFKVFVRDVATAVAMEEDGSLSDAEMAEQVGAKIAELVENNNTLEAQLAAEQAAVAALGAESERTLKAIAAAKKLNSDRMARISPPELKCTVISADPNWDYVILDAGIDKGVVIGSRLAVLRGDRKICELNVTVVEDSRSSAEVVYTTIRPGDTVKPGDTIISVRNK
ncbi:MAG: hypothetical protein IJE66_05530 [Akkermansia sp.]|nr:hypothetical protein [Akkermansia sp.]